MHQQQQQSQQRQCGHILPSVLPPVRRIIAIGDLHGDFRVLLQCLRLAKVIDTYTRNWVGGDTVVVQLGDQVDSKCRPLPRQQQQQQQQKQKQQQRQQQCEKDDVGDELKIIKFLDELHRRAQETNGAVYSLLGNHELMNVMGNINYASAENLVMFGGAKGRLNQFAPSGEIAVYLACNRNSIMKIGDFIFVHGGLLPKKAQQHTLENINRIIREYLLGNKAQSEPEVQDMLVGQESPFWTRMFSDLLSGNSPESCAALHESIEYLKVKGMVVGHTVQPQGINSGCQGRIWRTDVALSRSFGPGGGGGGQNKKKKIQVLEILNNGSEINVL